MLDVSHIHEILNSAKSYLIHLQNLKAQNNLLDEEPLENLITKLDEFILACEQVITGDKERDF